MYPFMLTEAGQDLYEDLTAKILGTQTGMSRKWCRWFREHVILLKRHGKVSFVGKRILLFQPGWSLAPAILSNFITDQSVVVIEDRRRTSSRYLQTAIRESLSVLPHLMRTCNTALDTYKLSKLKVCKTVEQLTEDFQIHYLIDRKLTLQSVEDSSIDLLLSMGRLEHLSPIVLNRVSNQFNRIIRQGGFGSHIVDHRDHLSYFDPKRHVFYHLTLDDCTWERQSKGRQRFRNRLLGSDYGPIFNKTGFEVVANIHSHHRNDANGVDPKSFYGKFKNISQSDLEAAVSHFILRRL